MPRKQSLGRSFARIGRLIHSTLDLNEILEGVLSEAAQAVGSETAAVSLRQGGQWVVSHVYGFPGDVIGARMDDRQEPHAVLAIETRKPVVINDTFTDERVNREHMRQWGVRSVLVVPLVTEEQVIGVLFFHRHRSATPFQKRHVEFANLLASSLALAVRNARLFESLQTELAQRKQAEQALQEANERLQAQTEELQAHAAFLQSLIGAVPAPLFYKNAQGVFAGCNAAFESYLGLPKERIIGRNAYGIFPRHLAEIYDRKDREILEGKAANQVYEAPVRHADGTEHKVLCSKRPLRNQDGGLYGLIGVMLDITERRQTEDALRQAHEELQAQSEELTVANEELQVQSLELQQSEQRLRMALDSGKMGRWEWDLVGGSTDWCARTCELLGLDRFHQVGLATFLDCIHPDDRQAVQGLLADARNEARDLQTEFRVLRHRDVPRSEVAWLALHAKVICDPHQQAVRMIGVLYDVTPRKQMETRLRQLNEKLEEEVQAQTEELRNSIDRLQDEVVRRVLAEGRLRRSSRLLEAFFQHTITPLAFLDRQFHFVRVNDAFARAESRPPEFFVRKDYFCLYPRPEDRAVFEHVVQTKQPYHAHARLFAFSTNPQGELMYWNWRITPLLDEAGQVQFLVFSLEDVTERQRAFGELEHRAAQLQKLTLELAQAEDRERKRLAEILHDDLQQVLAAVKFHLNLLRGFLKSDPEAQELADQLAQMVKDAIEKSRSLSHELSPTVLYQSDLGETFEWLAQQVQTKHGLTVHTEVHDKVDSSSEPIRAFLFRAAQEVLFNAVKHAQVREARLRLQRRGDRLWLTIADRGRGFDPSLLGKTTGFGLFSIRERVELLGGRMKIRSAPGQGSVFLIAVPDCVTEAAGKGRREDTRTGRALSKPTAGELSPAVPDGTAAPRPLRILLVDDHKTVRAGLAVLIGGQSDMEVVGQAGDGHRAIELARELTPDVVIMDVALPMMSGDEVTRRIKAILPDTRIVGLSMFEEEAVAHKMYDAGAEVYLPKTGPSDGLLDAIRGRS